MIMLTVGFCVNQSVLSLFYSSNYRVHYYHHNIMNDLTTAIMNAVMMPSIDE